MFKQASTIERLNQMRAKAPNAYQSEALLRHLAIFQHPFGRSAVEAMAPDTMGPQEQTNAFATLRSWNIVKQISSKRFSIEEEIRAQYPPTESIRRQQLAFFIQCVSIYDLIWMKLRWGDVSSALQWGVQHHPRQGVLLAHKIQHNMHFSFPEEKQAILALMMLRHLEAQAVDWEQKGLQANDPEIKYDCYQQAFQFYSRVEDREGQGDTMILLGDLLCRYRQAEEGFQHYQRALEFYEAISHQEKISRTLELLYQRALKMELVIETSHYLKRLFPLLNTTLQTNYSYATARFLRWKKQGDVARVFFAQAYCMAEQLPEDEDLAFLYPIVILRDWGLMEYEQGDKEYGYAICQLAISQLIDLIERVFSNSTRDRLWHEMAHLHVLFEGVGCADLPHYMPY